MAALEPGMDPKDETVNDKTARDNEADTLHIEGFVEFLIAVIDGEYEFQHSYRINKGNANSQWRAVNNNSDEWSCDSLSDAFRKYFWAGKTFEETKCILDNLEKDLKNAYSNDSPAGDLDMFKATWEILKWGGVTNHNSGWLADKLYKGNLVESYKNAIQELDKLNSDNNKAHLKKKDWQSESSPYRMNAGYTKVYSLLCDDFIIYDSRVAATLGFLVSKYCEKKQLKSVPRSLYFPYLVGKESNTKKVDEIKCRNPSEVSTFQFHKLNDNSVHAMWNVQANLILSKAVKSSKNISNWTYESKDGTDIKLTKKDQLRALEAAFFMIGYNLKK